MDFGRIIKNYLDERGIKQAFLCKKTGIKKSKMSTILNGTRGISAEDFILICDALELDIDMFRCSSKQA